MNKKNYIKDLLPVFFIFLLTFCLFFSFSKNISMLFEQYVFKSVSTCHNQDTKQESKTDHICSLVKLLDKKNMVLFSEPLNNDDISYENHLNFREDVSLNHCFINNKTTDDFSFFLGFSYFAHAPPFYF